MASRTGSFHVHPIGGWNGPSRPPGTLTPAQAGVVVTREPGMPGPSTVEPEASVRSGHTREEWHGVSRDAKIAQEAPRVPWDEFVRKNLRWQNGEHFALIGPTGQGKTTMLLNLLPLHHYMTIFATKPRDDTLNALTRLGYIRMEQWRSIEADKYPRRVVWPNIAQMRDKNARLSLQRKVFDDAFDAIYMEGGWTLAIDELWYFTNRLDMGGWVEEYLSQARALGISLLCATQRPAFIPLMVYDQSTHLMFWRDNDEQNLRRLSGIGFRSADLIRNIVSNLDQYQVLYVNTRTGAMCRTRCPNVRLPEGR